MSSSRKVARKTAVVLYAICDLLSVSLVFVFLAKEPHTVNTEIFSFKFGLSTFDILLLGVVRFSILIGGLVGMLFNKVYAAQRLQDNRKCVAYYACFQVFYILVKIVNYGKENGDDVVPDRFWIMSGLTLFSSPVLYFCWKALIFDAPANFRKLGSYDVMDHVGNESGRLEQDPNDTTMDGEESLTTRCVLYELIKMAKPDFHFIIPGLMFLVTCSVCQSFIPYYTGLVVNYIVIDRSVKKSNDALISLALITLLRGFTAGMRGGFFRYILGRYKIRMQSSLFSNLMQMEIGFFDTHKTGELISRLTADSTKVGDGLGIRLNVFMRSVVKILGVLFFMIKLSWKLSTVTLIAMPVVAIISEHFGTKCRALSVKVQNTLAYANASAEEVISTMRTVRSFAAETNEVARYRNLLENTRLCMREQSIVSACYMWSTEFTNFVMTLLILYYGGYLFLRNEMLGGHLVSFILYSFELTYATLDIGNVYTGLMEVVGASKNIFTYIKREPKVKINMESQHDANISGDVEFRNVSFSYPSREDVPVLKNVSFTAKKGEVVALVGSSGGGKSSIINLLEHFYEPLQGEILIDGVPVKNYNHRFIHEKMSLVQQEPVLFARTILENIKYGLDGDVSEGDVEKSAELANAHQFISCMPNGYATQSGDKGTQLSGGQKQRIAIARALIRKPIILLLDEATSALDSESEYLVQQAINNNLSGRTVIVIAHRLSTVEKADKILVMREGEIIENGRHHELIERQGPYSELVKRQLLGLSEETVERTGTGRVHNVFAKQARSHDSFTCFSCSSSMSVVSNIST